MASQPPDHSRFIEIPSFVRGYHAYQDVWQPIVGEVLVLEREPENHADRMAVAVMKSRTVVGHVPKNLSTVFSQFLRRTCNKGVAEVMGEKVNRGGGHGLE